MTKPYQLRILFRPPGIVRLALREWADSRIPGICSFILRVVYSTAPLAALSTLISEPQHEISLDPGSHRNPGEMAGYAMVCLFQKPSK